MNNSAIANVTEGASQTFVTENGATSGVGWISSKAGASPNETMTWTTANQSYGVAVVSVSEAAEAAATTIDDITFDVPEWIGLPAGDHTLEAEDDNGTVSLAAITFQLPAGWVSQVADGTGGSDAASLAKQFLDTYGITVVAGDVYATNGNTVGADGVPPSATGFTARLYDASASQWTTEYTYVPALVIDSATAGPLQAGDTLTITHSNASASGKTYTIGGLAVTEVSQDATTSVLTIPDPKTYGAKSLSYNTDLPIVVTDGADTASVLRQIAPDTGHFYGTVTDQAAWIAGGYTEVVDGDNVYAIRTSGTTTPVIASFSFLGPSTWDIYIQQASDGVWGLVGTLTVPAADLVAPVITLLGSATVTHAQQATYTDAGATASDNIDGDITADIVVTGSVNVNVVGSYILTYNVTDATGNPALSVTRQVDVEDQEAPTITLTGSSAVTHSHGTTYTDAGATASDFNDGDVTGSIVVTSTVNTNITGPYTVRYNVSDAAGNAATEVIRTVNVADIEPPVITLNGSASVNHPIGIQYSDAGATAFDVYDGDVTANIAANNTVNRNVEGTYYVYYDVSDSNGNAAIQAVRTVNVMPSLDTEKPVITMFGLSPVYVANGDVYNDAGARADDDTDGVITNNIQTINPVNTSINGTYTVRYNVADAAGNDADEVTRTVIVVASLDTEPPVITLSGSTSISIPYGEAFSEPGYSASDNEDGNITGSVAVTNPVNSTIPGTYTVRYNVSDAAGNDATEVTRSVTVQAQSSDNNPVITLNGGSVVEVLMGDQYIDAGATASDVEDGNLSSFIVVVSDVDTSVAGTYSVVYMVNDTDGNSATPVIRTVNVIDSVIPRIAINGPTIFYVLQDASFTDHGANVTSAIDGSSTVYAPESVDTSALGTYTLSYNYTDADSNVAPTVYRTVIVKLPDAPTISDLGILSNIAADIAA